jgi:hypothetical protein
MMIKPTYVGFFASSEVGGFLNLDLFATKWFCLFLLFDIDEEKVASLCLKNKKMDSKNIDENRFV